MLIPPSEETSIMWACNDLGISDVSELVDGLSGVDIIPEHKLEWALNNLSQGKGEYDLIHLTGTGSGTFFNIGLWYWQATDFNCMNLRYDKKRNGLIIDYNTWSGKETKKKIFLKKSKFTVKEKDTGPQELYGPGKYEETADFMIYSMSKLPPSLFAVKMWMYKNGFHMNGYRLVGGFVTGK